MRLIDADAIEYDFNIKTYADNRVMVTKLLADKDTIDAMPTVSNCEDTITEIERDLVSKVFQNYYCMDIDDIAESSDTAESLFIKLGLIKEKEQ